jgi:hypothetical protein
VEVNEFFDLEAMSLSNDLIALPPEKGEEGDRAGLMLISAGISPFEADIGTRRLALGVNTHLLRLLVVYARHVLH